MSTTLPLHGPLFRSISMQNMEIVASNLTKLWPFKQGQVTVYIGHAFLSKIRYALVNAYKLGTEYIVEL